MLLTDQKTVLYTSFIQVYRMTEEWLWWLHYSSGRCLTTSSISLC